MSRPQEEKGVGRLQKFTSQSGKLIQHVATAIYGLHGSPDFTTLLKASLRCILLGLAICVRIPEVRVNFCNSSSDNRSSNRHSSRGSATAFL